MSIEQHVQALLTAMGEDPNRHGLQKTPHRVAKAIRELTQGYEQRLEDIVNDALFPAPNHHMVLVQQIPVHSLCEHHLLPFMGHCHVAYLPQQHIIGLSKIARIVAMFAQRLQVQERLTQDIADALQDALKTDHVAVMVSAQHLCMSMRGVNIAQSTMKTSVVTGDFNQCASLRQEWLQQINTL